MPPRGLEPTSAVPSPAGEGCLRARMRVRGLVRLHCNLAVMLNKQRSVGGVSLTPSLRAGFRAPSPSGEEQ